MPEFTNVAVHSNKGLKRLELLGLGKINVLCGANNSGKTSVLECLADERRNHLGSATDSIDVGRIEEFYTQVQLWRYGHQSNFFRAVVSGTISAKPVWFADEVVGIVSQVDAALRKSGHLRIDFPDRLEKALMKEIPSRPSVVLVPEKRGLSPKIQVNNSEAIHPNGSGIVNFLFAAKNSQAGSQGKVQFDAISSAFASIANGWMFDVFFTESNHLLLMFMRPGGRWLPADDCGAGFRDLLIILYFALAAKADTVLIEEPENHQHPDIQRKLINFLRTSTTKQFVISTHSSVFSNTLYADRVFSCRIEDEVKVENVTSRASLLASLGYSVADNLISDLVILVEGPSDKLILDEFFQKLGLPAKHTIRVWPLGGDIMNQLDLAVFAESYRVIALIDTDPKSKRIRDEFKAKCAEKKIPVHQLKFYAIENYLTIPAIEKVMHQKAPEGLVKLDPKKKVSDQLGFDVKRNSANIVREMSLDDIQGTDLMEFLKKAEEMLGIK